MYFSINNIKLIFALSKISFFIFELVIIEVLTLIFSLNSKPDLINSIKRGFISNNLDIL